MRVNDHMPARFAGAAVRSHILRLTLNQDLQTFVRIEACLYGEQHRLSDTHRERFVDRKVAQFPFLERTSAAAQELMDEVDVGEPRHQVATLHHVVPEHRVIAAD